MKILLVDDSSEQTHAVSAALERREFKISHASSVEQAITVLATMPVEAILLDTFLLSDGSGAQSFYRIQASAAGIPIVVFTAENDQALALQFVKDGAQDFLVKGVASDDSVARCLQYAVERNRVEVALRNGEERLKVILENSYDAFISMDSKRLITDWNAQAEKTFGWSKKEVLGQNLSYIIPPHLRRRYVRDIEEFFANHDGNLLKTSKELVARHKNGSEFPVELTIFRVKEDAHFTFCTFVRDITEQKQSNADLEQVIQERTHMLMQSNEELHQFAKITAHDLQEPLRTIQGFASLLAENCNGKLDKDGNEFIEYILDGVQRMQLLIQSVLLHSQIPTDATPNSVADCNSVLDEVLSNLSATLTETSTNLEVGVLPSVAVERTQVLQLFQNLISNSIKYRSEQPPQISISAEASANEWLFSFTDNGIGIDPKYAANIFDMFSRLNNKTKYPGTGIGLAICKKIVASHGGNIWVDSKLGQGSIFLFTLPAIKKGRKNKMTGAIEILLVEDTPSDIRLTQEALKHATFKHNLTIKNDGVEALDYLNEIKNSPGGRLPDIILLDLNMPRMNGHEVLAEISKDKNLSDIPVVLLTVSEREEDIMDALHSKMNYYIAKPVTGEKLSTLINAIHDLQHKEQAHDKVHSNDEVQIRMVLAGNPHTSSVALKKLAEDPNERVRSRVAENASLPLELFRNLVMDPSTEVRSSIGENPNTPEEIFEVLAKDASDDVRLALSVNSILPLHLLKVLADDDNMYVASNAQKTLKTLEESAAKK